MTDTQTMHDALVIGAGYAGLTAGLALTDAGLDAVVLEAADRAGGRTWSERHERAGAVDHGGQWVGPTQTRLLALAERFGCERFPTYDAGTHVELWPDGLRFDAATGEEYAGPGMAGYADAVAHIEAIAATIDTERPAASPNAVALDSTTVESWLRELDEAAAARVRLGVQGVWAVEPRDLSMLHLAFYVASAGSWDQLMLTLGYAQDSRFVVGAQGPALAVAEHLGERVRLGQPVRSVRRAGEGFEVRTDGDVFRARKVVAATPPPATRAIDFVPALPYHRRRWLERSVMGDVAKIHVVYDTPFWRERGASGQASLYTADHLGVVFDNSPPDGSCGVLVGFAYGDRLREWAALGDAARRESVLTTLARLHGPEAASPVDYLEKNWTDDRWIGGAYAAVPAPGAWIEYGDDGWRAPDGGLHWAGSEVSDRWHGYIDGAIRSGERAAAAVLAELRG